jgi:hypothetical protein
MFVTVFSVFALIVIAGCGGGGTKSAASSSTSTSTPAATGASGAAGFAAYSKCMTSHGIPASALTRRGNGPPTTGTDGSAPPANSGGGSGNPPTPSLPAGVTQAQYQAALDACRSQLPAGGGAGAGAGGGANSAEFAAYRNCLQLHGVTLPTGGQRPSGQTATTGQTATAPPAGGLGGLNTSDPTVQAALTACMSLRPAQGSPTTSTTAP